MKETSVGAKTTQDLGGASYFVLEEVDTLKVTTELEGAQRL